MKKILLVLIFLPLLFSSCSTCPVCPPQDSYILHPYAGPTLVPKGHFENRESWKTEKELKEWFDKMVDGEGVQRREL